MRPIIFKKIRIKIKGENRWSNRRGFVALVAVILLSTGTLAFSLTTMMVAAAYADSVMRREMRIQAGLYTNSCIETVKLFFAKDVFLNGYIEINDFGCTAEIKNNFAGTIEIRVKAGLGDIANPHRVTASKEENFSITPI